MRRLVTRLALAGMLVFGGGGALVVNAVTAHADPPDPLDHIHFFCFTVVSDVFAQTGDQARAYESDGYDCFRLTRTGIAPWP